LDRFSSHHIITKFNEKFSNTHECAEDYKKFLKTGSVTNLQKKYSEGLPNSAEELRQRIRNAVVALTMEEIVLKNFLRCGVELCAES
jgi:hypothetical protein